MIYLMYYQVNLDAFCFIINLSKIILISKTIITNEYSWRDADTA